MHGRKTRGPKRRRHRSPAARQSRVGGSPAGPGVTRERSAPAPRQHPLRVPRAPSSFRPSPTTGRTPSEVETGVTQLPGYEFSELVADTYRAAALAGADMRRATEALEEIRSSAETDESYLDTWYTIDHQIGLTDEMSFQRELIAL